MKLGEVGDTIFLRIPAKNLIQIRCVARDMDLCLLTKSVSTCTNLPFAKYPLIGGETLLSARQLLLTWLAWSGALLGVCGRVWAWDSECWPAKPSNVARSWEILDPRQVKVSVFSTLPSHFSEKSWLSPDQAGDHVAALFEYIRGGSSSPRQFDSLWLALESGALGAPRT